MADSMLAKAAKAAAGAAAIGVLLAPTGSEAVPAVMPVGSNGIMPSQPIASHANIAPVGRLGRSIDLDTLNNHRDTDLQQGHNQRDSRVAPPRAPRQIPQNSRHLRANPRSSEHHGKQQQRHNMNRRQAEACDKFDALEGLFGLPPNLFDYIGPAAPDAAAQCANTCPAAGAGPRVFAGQIQTSATLTSGSVAATLDGDVFTNCSTVVSMARATPTDVTINLQGLSKSDLILPVVYRSSNGVDRLTQGNRARLLRTGDTSSFTANPVTAPPATCVNDHGAEECTLANVALDHMAKVHGVIRRYEPPNANPTLGYGLDFNSAPGLTNVLSEANKALFAKGGVASTTTGGTPTTIPIRSVTTLQDYLSGYYANSEEVDRAEGAMTAAASIAKAVLAADSFMHSTAFGHSMTSFEGSPRPFGYKVEAGRAPAIDHIQVALVSDCLTGTTAEQEFRYSSVAPYSSQTKKPTDSFPLITIADTSSIVPEDMALANAGAITNILTPTMLDTVLAQLSPVDAGTTVTMETETTFGMREDAPATTIRFNATSDTTCCLGTEMTTCSSMQDCTAVTSYLSALDSAASCFAGTAATCDDNTFLTNHTTVIARRAGRFLTALEEFRTLGADRLEVRTTAGLVYDVDLQAVDTMSTQIDTASEPTTERIMQTGVYNLFKALETTNAKGGLTRAHLSRAGLIAEGVLGSAYATRKFHQGLHQMNDAGSPGCVASQTAGMDNHTDSELMSEGAAFLRPMVPMPMMSVDDMPTPTPTPSVSSSNPAPTGSMMTPSATPFPTAMTTESGVAAFPSESLRECADVLRHPYGAATAGGVGLAILLAMGGCNLVGCCCGYKCGKKRNRSKQIITSSNDGRDPRAVALEMDPVDRR